MDLAATAMPTSKCAGRFDPLEAELWGGLSTGRRATRRRYALLPTEESIAQ
jgi:hypothetical protein